MAILHVSASGSNTSPYETWDKAASALETVDGLTSAGDTVYIDKTFDTAYSWCAHVGEDVRNPAQYPLYANHLADDLAAVDAVLERNHRRVRAEQRPEGARGRIGVIELNQKQD